MSFGSPESRAMARRILQESKNEAQLSQNDWDCLRLYCGAVSLKARMNTDGWGLEGTAAYAQGKRIWQRLSGPTIPAHVDPKLQRAGLASITFEMVFHREPRAGDTLRLEDVQGLAITARRDVEEFIRAWERQLPEMVCPLRVDGERVFQRISKKVYFSPPSSLGMANEGFYWQEATHSGQEQWRDVEREAFLANPTEDQEGASHCTAVIFLGVIDGKHRCKPLDENANVAVIPED